jgi:hypothetical protein
MWVVIRYNNPIRPLRAVQSATPPSSSSSNKAVSRDQRAVSNLQPCGAISRHTQDFPAAEGLPKFLGLETL